MRLSNNLMYQMNVNKMLDGQQKVADSQQRINTGQKYLSASEGPSAVAQGMLYEDSIQKDGQYTKNINQLNGRLNTEHSILGGMNETILAAQSLTIQAGNGAYSEKDLASIATQLEELQKSLLGNMNSQAEDGSYIFSGYQDNVQTYTFNDATQKYEYQGDQGQHEVTIAKGVQVKSSDNGFTAFEKVDARLNVEPNTVPSGNVTSGTVFVENEGDFSKFHKENYNYDPSLPTANTYNVIFNDGAPGPDTYEIQRDGVSFTPPVTGDVTDEPIEFGGLKIEFEGEAPGQLDFTLEKPKKENVLNTMQDLITGLRDPTLKGDALKDVLSDGLEQLKNASDQVVFTQATLGGRMNVVESVTGSNSALNTNNVANKASLVEIDIATAVSELTKHETALQASQSTFGRLSKLSLFDYI